MSLKLLEEPFWKGLKVKFPLCKDVNSDLRSGNDSSNFQAGS